MVQLIQVTVRTTAWNRELRIARGILTRFFQLIVLLALPHVLVDPGCTPATQLEETTHRIFTKFGTQFATQYRPIPVLKLVESYIACFTI
jgi:hypothetical protein